MSIPVVSSPPHPVLEMLSRYRAVFNAAWAARRDMAGPARMANEAAFLPAALSLQATPAHPAPRRVAWVICLLFISAVGWAALGEIDIVAVAPGRIVVSERTKTLQPLEASVVKRVLVKDGDVVQAGQVLVELDATNAKADGASIGEQLAAAWSDELRTQALLDSVGLSKAPALALPLDATWGKGGMPPISSTTGQLQAEWFDIKAKLSKLSAEHTRRQAEIATVQALIAKLNATLPIARLRETDFKSLTEQGFISGHAGQDRTRERIEQERDLATQQARMSEARAALAETDQARSAYLAETQRLLSERHAQAEMKRLQLLQDRSKSDQRSRLTQLTASVAGKVQQVAVHTEGGVVTPAQVLMVIVPSDARVTAEVTVDNKDIGFVNVGDTAAVKLETFPFTRYGTVAAKVSRVTADAVNDEKKGAIFPAMLTLEKSQIVIDGKSINLSPGMNVTAEIKTGRRKVLDYLISPLQRTVNESFGER